MYFTLFRHHQRTLLSMVSLPSTDIDVVDGDGEIGDREAG